MEKSMWNIISILISVFFTSGLIWGYFQWKLGGVFVDKKAFDELKNYVNTLEDKLKGLMDDKIQQSQQIILYRISALEESVKIVGTDIKKMSDDFKYALVELTKFKRAD